MGLGPPQRGERSSLTLKPSLSYLSQVHTLPLNNYTLSLPASLSHSRTGAHIIQPDTAVPESRWPLDPLHLGIRSSSWGTRQALLGHGLWESEEVASRATASQAGSGGAIRGEGLGWACLSAQCCPAHPQQHPQQHPHCRLEELSGASHTSGEKTS